MAICQEAHQVGKQASACYIGEETAVVVVENRERVTARTVAGRDEFVPAFYIAKYHKGELISEQFV